jgi:hypothetical protein
MSPLAIRCHRCAPVDVGEVEQWLADELERLRTSAPHAVLRLLRLSQPAPAGDIDIGWLIELEPANGDPPLDEDILTQVVRDLRLLGLQPTVMGAIRRASREPAP